MRVLPPLARGKLGGALAVDGGPDELDVADEFARHQQREVNLALQQPSGEQCTQRTRGQATGKTGGHAHELKEELAPATVLVLSIRENVWSFH